MGESTKKLNKRLVGLVIGSTVVGAGTLVASPAGREKIKSWSEKLIDKAKDGIDFIKGGLSELQKQHSKTKDLPKSKDSSI